MRFLSSLPRWVGRLLAVFLLAAALPAAEPVIWRLETPAKVAEHATRVVGEPKAERSTAGAAISFGGVRDGIFVPENPLAGATAYTIEVRFRPAAGGAEAQRFFHLQDERGYRALLETRLDGKGGWWLDTFIQTSETRGSGVTLIDPAKVHPVDQWYWVALRYDGRVMAHFVEGKKEIEAAGKFVPFSAGSISLGVRQTLVYWFKGEIAEVRFHREAIAEGKMQRSRAERR